MELVLVLPIISTGISLVAVGIGLETRLGTALLAAAMMTMAAAMVLAL